MQMKTKGLIGAAVACCALAVVRADEKGVAIFTDSFDAEGTFAENWVSKRCLPKDGRIRIPATASLTMRGATPLEFVAEADITLGPSWSMLPPVAPQQGWGGFTVGGQFFCVQPCGKSFMVWRLPEERHADGRYQPIEGFALGRPVRLTLVRKRLGEANVKYVYLIDGKRVYEFVAPLPEKVTAADGQEGYQPVTIMAYKVDLDLDNFALSAVRHEDDSPNTVLNSGFEHAEDGVPTHFGLLGEFNFASCPPERFHTDYLRRYQVDTAERHSGRQSLRVLVNDASRRIVIAPWRTSSVKGAAGVFSAWMKASVDGIRVNLSLDSAVAGKAGDGFRTVEVGREWRRYEVTCGKMKGKQLYSPVAISVPAPGRSDAKLWIDDVQCEIVALPEGGFDPNRSYATPYRPSELDKGRFGTRAELPPSPTLSAPRLPAGVKPTVVLDDWKDEAFVFSDFRVGQKRPTRRTEAFLACDDDNLYVGLRFFGEPPDGLAEPRCPVRDLYSEGNSYELLFKPNPDEGCFHLSGAANGDPFDLHANDLKWDGTWTTEARANAAAGAVDYLVTIPFSDVAPWGLGARWGFNICRNDRVTRGAEEYVASSVTEQPNFRLEERWGTLVLPTDVVARWAAKAGGRRKTVATDAVLGRLDFYMNEEFAQWRVTNADGRVTVAKKPLAEIPAGTNVVTFVANGKTYSDTVVKLPYRKGATQVNRWTRSIVHDGRNELFIGLGIGVTGYFGWTKDADPFPPMFRLLKADSFRHFLFQASSRSGRMAEAKACLEASRAAGFLCAFWSDYDIWNYNERLEYERRKPIDDVSQEKMVAFARNYGHIVTHLAIDEPELYKPSAWSRGWLERIKAYYPYTPVQMNNTVMGVPSKYADLKTDILMLDDYLTNNEGRTVDSVVRHVDEMRAVPGGKPCWYFLVGENMTLHYKNTSYAEQVAQSWGCLCAGCTGLSWFFGFPATWGSYQAIVDVNREAQALAPVLLSEELCAPATADQPKAKLRHLTRTLEGSWYVLSCNIDAKPLEQVTFVLPEGAPKNGMVEVLFENRTIPLKDGVFTDAYSAHTRHLYRIQSRKEH